MPSQRGSAQHAHLFVSSNEDQRAAVAIQLFELQASGLLQPLGYPFTSVRFGDVVMDLD